MLTVYLFKISSFQTWLHIAISQGTLKIILIQLSHNHGGWATGIGFCFSKSKSRNSPGGFIVQSRLKTNAIGFCFLQDSDPAFNHRLTATAEPASQVGIGIQRQFQSCGENFGHVYGCMFHPEQHFIASVVYYECLWLRLLASPLRTNYTGLTRLFD